jgi:hypothetical protein
VRREDKKKEKEEKDYQSILPPKDSDIKAHFVQQHRLQRFGVRKKNEINENQIPKKKELWTNMYIQSDQLRNPKYNEKNKPKVIVVFLFVGLHLLWCKG